MKIGDIVMVKPNCIKTPELIGRAGIIKAIPQLIGGSHQADICFGGVTETGFKASEVTVLIKSKIRSTNTRIPCPACGGTGGIGHCNLCHAGGVVSKTTAMLYGRRKHNIK